MKKIGVISDVHGNLEALQAILKLFDKEGVEEIIHTGDVVDIGPQSRECLELLLTLPNVTLLLGNHDRDFVLNQSEMRFRSHVPAEHKRQVFSTMSDEQRKIVADFPVCVTRKLGKKTVAFAHYAFYDGTVLPNSFLFKGIVVPPSAESFDEIFSNVLCDAIFFGHKHEPCDICGKKLYVDIGSVGCHADPYAKGIVIEYDDFNFTYRRVAVPYDMEKTRRKLFAVACGEQLYEFYFIKAKKE